MLFTFQCPQCGKAFQKDSSLAGQKGRCKDCGLVFTIPDPQPGRPARPAPRFDDPDDLPPLGVTGRIGSVRKGSEVSPARKWAIITVVIAAAVVPSTIMMALRTGDEPADAAKERPDNVQAEAEEVPPILPVPVPRPRVDVRGGARPLPALDLNAVPVAWDPFPDQPPDGSMPPIRPNIMAQYDDLFTKMAALLDEEADILATIRDARSAQDASVRMGEVTRRAQQLVQIRPPDPNAAERNALSAKYLVRLDQVMTRIRDQAARIGQVGMVMVSLDLQRARLRGLLASVPAPDPEVDVILPDFQGDSTGDAVGYRLKQMTDVTPPRSFRFSGFSSNGRHRQAYRLGPVRDVRAFARAITFGKVKSIQGRKIVVTDVRPSAADIAEAKEARKAEEARQAADRARAQKEAIAREETDIRKAVDLLKKNDPQSFREAVRLLSGKTPNDAYREEVARRMEDLLDPRDQFFTSDQLKVLARWAGPENVPALIGHLKDAPWFARGEIIDGLIRLKDPTATEALAAQLGHDAFKVRPYLVGLGKSAEPAVRMQLSQSEAGLRREACNVLKEIGTKDSLDSLEWLAKNDPDGLVRWAAGDAVKMIRKRTG